MPTIEQPLSEQIRQGVVSHIVRYDLLRRREFRDRFLCCIEAGLFDKLAGKRRRILWELVVAGAEAYLTGRTMATSDFHLAASTSRTTAGRCLRILEQLGIFRLQADHNDRRRSLVSFSVPFGKILDHYVNECFEEFEDLITTHHDRERREAERALADSEVRWRSLAEESPDLLVLLDSNFDIQFINYTLPELPPEQVIGNPVSRYLPDDDRQRIMRVLETVASSRRPAWYETSYLTPAGEIVFFESRVVARIVDDTVIGLTIHARNIGERKRAEDALRESETRYRRLVDSSPDAIGVHVDGKIVFVNPAGLRLFGADRPEQLLGRDAFDFIEPEFRQQSRERVRKMLEKDWIAEPFNVRWRRLDGNVIDVEVNGRMVIHDGKPGIETVARDVSERRRMEEALRESEERYRSLVEIAPDAILITLEDKVVYANQAAADVFGTERPEQLLNKAPSSLLPANTRDSMQERRKRILSGQTPPTALETKVLKADGSEFDAELKGIPVSWKGNVALLTIFRDISERKLVGSELARARKTEAIGRLTGGVAHEFNNVLMAVMANLEMLEADLEGDEGQLEMVRTASLAARRGADVTNRLTAFGRHQALTPENIDPSEFAPRTRNLLKSGLHENIEIETLVHRPLDNIFADPGQLHAALSELALNSSEAMPEGGTLTLEYGNTHLDRQRLAQSEAAPGDYALVAVQDTGSGIAAGDIERIFDPFFTTRGMATHSGLGLSMVQGFVRQSAGHIEIESEPGAGTTVRLYLPRADEGEEGAAEATLGGGETILLVEDDEVVRASLAGSLRHLGYVVVDAEDAAAALVVLGCQPIDLVVTDIIMPGGMSGFDLAQTVATEHPGPGFVFMSGYADALAHNGSVPVSSGQLLRKPFNRRDLGRAIRHALDKPN